MTSIMVNQWSFPMQQAHFVPVPVEKAYRLLNLGATSLVASEADGETDVMPATWICPLDVVPFKATAVIDHTHFTRRLIEKSGYFALMIPAAGIVDQVMKLGWVSKNDDPKKVEKSGAELFFAEGSKIPLVKGCVAWAIFRVIPEAHNEKTYDLFIGECVGAWADDRVFKNGHWLLGDAPRDLRPLHYSAGGHWFLTGEALTLKEYGD